MKKRSGGNFLACAQQKSITLFQYDEGSIKRLFSVEPYQNLRGKDYSITDLHWNHNNLVLLSCCDEGYISINRGFLSKKNPSSNGGTLGMLPSSPDDLEELRCISLSSGSRYLATGGNRMEVRIWDLKGKKVLRTFDGHANYITKVLFSHNDKHVTSSDASGEILMFDVLSGKELSSLTDGMSSRPDHISDLEYSFFFPQQILASACHSGKVKIWDVERGNIVHTFTDHREKCSEICFSHLNDVLLLSVGFDERIILYDIKDRRSVQSIDSFTKSPLTTLSFLENGHVFACGTQAGQIHFYDLRKGAKPFQILQDFCDDSSDGTKRGSPIHAIHSLKFQQFIALEKSVDPPKLTFSQPKSQPKPEGQLDGNMIPTQDQDEEKEKEKEKEKDDLSTNIRELEQDLESELEGESEGEAPQRLSPVLSPKGSGEIAEKVKDEKEEEEEEEEQWKDVDMDEEIERELKNLEMQDQQRESQRESQDLSLKRRELVLLEEERRRSGREFRDGPTKGDTQSIRITDLVQRMERMESQFVKFKGDVHQDIQNLQIEMLRQFQIQQEEIKKLVLKLANQMQTLYRENKKLKQERFKIL